MNAPDGLEVTTDDVAAMVEAFDNVAQARDMKVRRIESAAFALRNRYRERLATTAPLIKAAVDAIRVLENPTATSIANYRAAEALRAALAGQQKGGDHV